MCPLKFKAGVRQNHESIAFMHKIVLDAHMLGEKEGGNETYVPGLLAGFSTIPQNERSEIFALRSSIYQPSSVENIFTWQPIKLSLIHI